MSFIYLFVLIYKPGETIQCPALLSHGTQIAMFSRKCIAGIFISKTGIRGGIQKKNYIKQTTRREQPHEIVRQETGTEGEPQEPNDQAQSTHDPTHRQNASPQRFNPCLTKLFFVTRLTGGGGGSCNPLPRFSEANPLWNWFWYQ